MGSNPAGRTNSSVLDETEMMGFRKFAIAIPLIALLCAAVPSLADDTHLYGSKMDCGGQSYSITLACPKVNESTPFDCRTHEIDVGYTAISETTVENDWLEDSNMPAVAWLCITEGQSAAVELYFTAGGNCDNCEKLVWIDKKGHVLSNNEVRAAFPRTLDNRKTDWVWLNNPNDVH